MKKSSKQQVYFFPARYPTQEQFSLFSNLANKLIYNGIKYIPNKETI